MMQPLKIDLYSKLNQSYQIDFIPYTTSQKLNAFIRQINCAIFEVFVQFVFQEFLELFWCISAFSAILLELFPLFRSLFDVQESKLNMLQFHLSS